MAHTQARLNDSLNTYAVSAQTGASAGGVVDTAKASLGISSQLFYRAAGKEMTTMLEQSQAFNLKEIPTSDDTAAKFYCNSTISNLFIFWKKPTSSCL